jgi:phospholipase C
MDAFVSTHIASANDGPDNGFVTMGYFTRDDLAFYYALADAFCICDGYHCSVLGPTDPNRVMSVSGTIDPPGSHGGPVVETYSNRAEYYGAFSWEIEVPNLSAWRRATTGDLTKALPRATPTTSVPTLPATSLGDTSVAEQTVINALTGTEDVGVPYPPPTTNSMPAQETSSARRRT